jgi:hypothetical protein
MTQHEPGHDTPTPTQAAAYIAELSANLSKMARNHGHNALGYILDMARLEAQSITGAASEKASSAAEE